MTTPALQARLANWARYVRVTEKQGISPTGRFCEQLARDAGQTGYRESKPRPDVDEVDGQVIEEAVRKCEPRTRDLLRWLYVRNAKIEVICRKLGIPARPKSSFDRRRYEAEAQLAIVLEGPTVRDAA